MLPSETKSAAAPARTTTTNAPESINNLSVVQNCVPPPTSFLPTPQVSSSSSHSVSSVSRWGPKVPLPTTVSSERSSPELVGTSGTVLFYPGSSSYLLEPGVVIDNDVEIIEDVEWAAEGDDNELASKPKLDRTCDPCGCSVPSSPLSSAPCCLDLSCVLFACQEECRSNCEAGDACGNKRIQRKQWKRLQIFDAGPKGKGLRVLEPVQQGEFIVEYVGKAIKKAYLDRLFRRYQHERMLYIMALDTNVYLDARKRGGVARFINHSCQPNCVVERWKVRGILRAGVFAMRDLQAGEELCFDYQWERKRGRAPTKCHCLSPNCRGTLELARSLEEQELEQQLSGHWKKPLVKRAGREIVNRSIKIFYQQSQEYFPADVCKYDEESTKHLVIYRHDLEEVWEDLSQEDWMILDEEAEQHYIIAKKKNLHPATASSSSLVMSAEQSQLPSAQHLPQQHCMMNYLYIQTPIKELFWSKHLIERCERNCGVTIQPTQFARPPLPPDLNNPEEVEKYQALDQSLDGTVWKLTVVGADVVKALTILGKNVAYLEKKNTQQDATATSGTNRSAWGIVDEVIIPRCVVDLVKKRLAVIRDKCRSVNISFAPSDSKSKQFARLLLEGSLQSDVHNAKVQLWQHLVAACVEVNSPLANCGVPRDLGFLGGELTSEQFRHLFASEKERLNQDANEDMRRSAFFTSFESTQRCTVWVQSEGDKGRIDGMSNRVVNEALPNAPRKIFFGCDPKDIPRLWNLVETRAAEVSRGVKYLYLGADRMYQQHMMQRGGQFFDYVERVTGASVTVDPMTGDHLRLDGKGKSHKDDAEGVVQRSVAEIDRVALAEEVIRLQIELYRDHCIRDQNWVFGRDWTLISNFLSSTVTDATATAATPTPALARMASSSKSTLDEKAITTGCLDISDIASKLNLQGSVAAHAAVILYRFATLQGQNQDFAPQAKIREVAIASLFLANKAQKIIKWKRLATVLEAAYQTYYPGTQFDRNKEEVLVLEDRVIAAEYEILTVLNYDVFWRGVDWMLAAAIESGHVAEPLARNAFEFAVSGPVLAAGPTLWLKYGPEYVFAAVAGFLSIDIEHLFTALNLIPLKVSQAAELIAHSIKFGNSSRKAAFHEVLNGGKQSLLNHLPHIKDTCIKSMSKGLVVGVGNRITATSESQQRFQIIGSQLRQRRAYVGVEPAIVRDSVMPILDGISAESTCRIFVDKSSLEAGEDLILEGSWRAIAIAEHLLEAAMGNDGSFMAVDLPVEQISQGKLQAKCQPGLLQMGDVHTCDGWSGTIQASLTNDFTWGRKTGGKCCVAAKLQESTLREAGLRWWIPPRYGPSTSGSICEMFSLRSCETNLLTALKNLTKAFVGQAGQFPMLSEETSCEVSHDRNVAVSIQRWPSEKVAAREQERTSASKESGLQMGFSAAALQELQLLTELHGLIPSPLGHPNFMLPFGIAIPSPSPEIEPQQPDNDTEEDIFSLFRTSEENEKAARKQQKHKDLTTGPHLIFQPTPFVLQRFMSKKKIRDTSNGESSTLSQTLISSWFHDLLSGLVHCHANNVILRSLQSDQVVVDHAGVAKLGGFYRATVFAPEDLEKAENHLKSARAGSRKEKSDEEDYPNNGFVAPENLLGSMKHNKQTDIWAMGCLLANLLLGKPLFVGKDRESLLLSVYKVVGTPSKENYSEATKFSLYRKPTKKYKRGVEKAIRHMLTESGGRECEGAIDLLAQMLHLDPKKRITAVDTLKHHYMLDYLENCNSKSFQRDYVKGWLALKEKLLKQTKMEEDEAQTRARSLKRKANLIAASQAMDQEDDLYDMDELVLGSLSHKAA